MMQNTANKLLHGGSYQCQNLSFILRYLCDIADIFVIIFKLLVFSATINIRKILTSIFDEAT